MISEKGKPFMLQESVQTIVDNSGGNKAVIAQQAQIGLIDPTAAVLAGMYIDRIREAEALEKEQAATVAEQVFSPKPEPEAVSQMQLAQQGLGGAPAPAPAPAPKMPMAPRPPRGMTFPKPSQGIAPNLPNVNMGMAPPSNRSVAGVDKLPMGSGMIPRAASGGLLAFAGGGDVPGYATGTERPIESFGNYQDFGMRDPIAEQNDTGDIFAGFSNSLLSQQPGYMNFLKDYVPAESNPSDVYKQREKIITDELPKVDYDRVQQLVSPEAITKKKAELEERTGQRFTDDIALNMILGGLSAAEGKPSTGNVFSDILGSVSTAGKAAAPGVIQAFRDKRTAEDKMFNMEEEAAFKEIGLLGAQRQEQLQIKKLAMDSGDKQLQQEATERAAAIQGAIQAYVAKVSQKMGFNEKAAMAKVDNLTKFYETQGYDVEDPEIQAMIVDHAFSTVLTANALVKATATERKAHNKLLADVMKAIDDEYSKTNYDEAHITSTKYYTASADERERQRLSAKNERIIAEAYGLGVSPSELMRRSANLLDTRPPELNPEGRISLTETKGNDGPVVGETLTQNFKIGDTIEYEGVAYEILPNKIIKDIKTGKKYTTQGGELVEVN